ncbi:TPA: hypothetical protein JBB06_09575 [Legionella pneumophila subsp. pneumophila]|uniref:Uncharacterized protein n=2 Tax=Legionella pneumophila TaxID=446 RepID=Q5WUZ1_LEGPL|nr:hypothetical protein D7216_12875 [Legionella pneumophila]CAH16266.1 hypothetical protein lpl2026 [Legionella pneumophila str. Lens]HAT8939760.1 hypothetical protein [Legionella pneumophila subsp. pneumophila]RYW86454.1 hypothetical protein D7221_12690 [Legionella pneumophila]HAT9031228.1 hypothetical protein [Legionella pneumophila subsp. pneumophila]
MLFYIQVIFMNEKLIETQSNLIKQAETELIQSNQLLESLQQEKGLQEESDLDELDSLKSLILVLQYRLDTQNALSQLGHLQQYLLQLLGIEAKHSFEFNLERLAFALGTDELKQILAMLHHLVDSLLRVIAQKQLKESHDKRKSLEQTKQFKPIDTLVKVLNKQKLFMAKLEELKLVLENIGGAPQPGIIYDHIAALQGPISRFYQALQHGLGISNSLYQQLQKKNQLSYQLPDTLLKPEHVIRDMNFHPESQRLFKTTLERNKIENLEERAAAKRLGHFFNH